HHDDIHLERHQLGREAGVLLECVGKAILIGDGLPLNIAEFPQRLPQYLGIWPTYAVSEQPYPRDFRRPLRLRSMRHPEKAGGEEDDETNDATPHGEALQNTCVFTVGEQK